MYQPPLYYLIGAGTLSACKLSIDDPASVIVLRLLGLFFGVSQFVYGFSIVCAFFFPVEMHPSDYFWRLFCRCICTWRIM